MHRERTDIILHSRTIFQNIDSCVLIVVQIIDFASKTCVGFLGQRHFHLWPGLGILFTGQDRKQVFENLARKINRKQDRFF
jgi:hypothetical protein